MMMASLHTFHSHLSVAVGGNKEHEIDASVSYWFTPAWPQSREGLGSDATIEIDNIQIKQDGEYHNLPDWLVSLVSDDGGLIEDCFADREASDEYARDLAAERD